MLAIPEGWWLLYAVLLAQYLAEQFVGYGTLLLALLMLEGARQLSTPIGEREQMALQLFTGEGYVVKDSPLQLPPRREGRKGCEYVFGIIKC